MRREDLELVAPSCERSRHRTDEDTGYVAVITRIAGGQYPDGRHGSSRRDARGLAWSTRRRRGVDR